MGKIPPNTDSLWKELVNLEVKGKKKIKYHKKYFHNKDREEANTCDISHA